MLSYLRHGLILVFVFASVTSYSAIIEYGIDFGANNQAAFNAASQGEYQTSFGPDGGTPGGEYPWGSQSSTTPHGNPSFTFRMMAHDGGEPSVPSEAYVVGEFAARRALSTEFPITRLRIDFTGSPSAVTAVGADFYLTDIDEDRVVGNVTIFIKVAGNDTPFEYSIADSLDEPSTADFRGFTSDTEIEWMDVLAASPSTFATIDDLSVGAITPVPEPATTGAIAALFLAVCSVTHLWNRRRALSKVAAVAA